MVRSLIVIAGCLALAVGSRAEVTLVRDGQPAALIVIPDSPAQVVEYAARELAHHVRRASGATLETVREADLGDRAGSRVFIGACEATAAAGINVTSLPPEGWVARTVGEDLFLAGSDRSGYQLYGPVWAGSLWATYELLETELGVRWLWPGELGEFVPTADTIVLPDLDRTGAPAFLQRSLRSAMALAGNRMGPEMLESEGYRQAQADERVWLRRMRMGNTVTFTYGHAFGDWWERFGDAHPEWFNLLPNGRREPLGHPSHISMCVAEPGLHEQIVAEWWQRRQEHPDGPVNVNCCENDTAGLCVCDGCLAWDVLPPGQTPEERMALVRERWETLTPDRYRWDTGLGSLSDRYARFYLAVQELAREHDPDAMVFGYAYGNYREPPREVRLNADVIIGYVPGIRFPASAEERQSRRDEWQGWADAGASLLLRPNYFLYGYCMPYVFAEQFGREFGFCARNGMIGTDFDSLTGMWATQGPNLYMLGRMHATPLADPQAVLAEYYAGFGPAAEEVRAYFDYWEARSEELIAGMSGGWHEYVARLHEIWTEEMFAQARPLLDAARSAADGPEFAARVAFLEQGFEHARLTAEVSRVFATTDDLARRLEVLGRLDRMRAQMAGGSVANLPMMQWLETRYFERWPTAELEGRDIIGQLPLQWRLRWDPEEVGQAEGWFDPAIDATDWLPVSVKSAWEKQPVGETWRGEHGRDYDGLAWYRVQFDVPEALRGRRVFLLFGAVDEAATVWVNGQLVGEHPFVHEADWTTPFTMEFTDAARFGEANTVAVLVEDRSGAGGVWRPVLLVAE